MGYRYLSTSRGDGNPKSPKISNMEELTQYRYLSTSRGDGNKMLQLVQTNQVDGYRYLSTSRGDGNLKASKSYFQHVLV